MKKISQCLAHSKCSFSFGYSLVWALPKADSETKTTKFQVVYLEGSIHDALGKVKQEHLHLY